MRGGERRRVWIPESPQRTFSRIWQDRGLMASIDSAEERIRKHSCWVYSCSGKAVARDWRYMGRMNLRALIFLALRYFEWVDQLGITDETCIDGKKQTKIFHQEIKNSGREGKFNIQAEELSWERSRSQSGLGSKAMSL
jgi:hypothetical protein